MYGKDEVLFPTTFFTAFSHTMEGLEITCVDVSVAPLVGPFRNIMAFFTSFQGARSSALELEKKHPCHGNPSPPSLALGSSSQAVWRGRQSQGTSRRSSVSDRCRSSQRSARTDCKSLWRHREDHDRQKSGICGLHSDRQPLNDL